MATRPSVQPGLGREVDDILAAYAVALAMYEHEPRTSRAKPWLGGMVVAGQWIVGYVDTSPVTNRARPATVLNVGDELLAAGQIDMPEPGRHSTQLPGAEQMWARGSYRMLAYALGYTDELPVKLSTEVAEALSREVRAA